MMPITTRLCLLLALLCAALPASAAAPAEGPLRVGVTLHPYYSWTRNVVGDAPGVEVVAVLPGDVDAGDYQPRPEDIRKLADLDAIVVNALGHDDFIEGMIQASGNSKLLRIKPNEGTPVVQGNSHTFISFTNAIQQSYAIARELGRLRPALAATFQKNAATYAARLRGIKAKAATSLANPRLTRVVTVHDGYVYLLQELGLEVAGIVQPAHGLMPSATELKEMVALLKREKIAVVLSEAAFPEAMAKVLREEGGARIYIISHVASGPFTAEKFEQEMSRNADVLVQALVAE